MSWTPDRDAKGNYILNVSPFANKSIPEGNLFKRVHGVNATIPANTTQNIDFIVPYNVCKFNGAEIFGTDLGDTVSFSVLDTFNNDISGLDPATFGNNFKLNQFGHMVEMPPKEVGKYANTSNYDADLFVNMVVRCTYTNNTANSKYIGMNVELHEVKAVS